MRGRPVVFTADRTVMTEYRGNLYVGFAANLPYEYMPSWLANWLFFPRIPDNPDGTVKYALTGLRRLESACINRGFSRSDIATVNPDMVERFIGEETKVVGISVIDPLGLGPASTTFCSLLGGTPRTFVEFKRLMDKIKKLKRKYKFKVVVGGPGAWQLMPDHVRAKFSIDYLVMGEGEVSFPAFLEAVTNGDGYVKNGVYRGRPPKPSEIPPIADATRCGIIDVTRGCGRGCKFCAPATAGRLRSLPLETIEEDIKVNLEKGQSSIVFQSEDYLRYGVNGVIPDKDAVLTLFKTAFELGAKRVSGTHTSLAST